MVDITNLESKEKPKSIKTLLLLLFTYSTAYLLYTNVAVLLPNFCKERHEKFGSLGVGILFASYQGAFIIAAPLIGKYLHKFGRRNALFAAVMIIGLATAVFAGAGLIEGDWAWYFVSIGARLI